MDDKYKNGDGGYGIYQRKKWGDNQNQNYPNSEQASGILDGVKSTGLTYTNGFWNWYHRKCGVNKTHTPDLHADLQKEG